MGQGGTILRAVIGAAAIAFGVPALGQTPQVPPGAQPGAQQSRDLTPRLPVPRDPFGFEIPPVIERPLGVDEGARVFVERFVVRSILDEPSSILLTPRSRARVQRLVNEARAAVEQERIARQRLDEVGPDGFSDAERAQILEFMQRVTRDLDPDRGIQGYEQLVDEIRLSRLERSRGMTIGQIQQVADAVTQIYRADGYFLARAIVPAQDVADGVVTLQVLEGRLGDTLAENNEMYSEGVLAWPFATLQGALINIDDIEGALLTLSDLPGVQSFGTFRPGQEVGTADLIVSVQDEQRTDWDLRLDNHGSRFTGRYRAMTSFNVNNPFGFGDRAGFTLMRSYRPANTLLGSVSYDMPLFGPRTRMRFDYQRNTFDISTPQLQGVDFGGLSESATIGVERAFLRSRAASAYWQWDLTRKTGETDQAGNVFNRDELAIVGLQFRYELIDSTANAIEAAFIRLDRGFDGVMGVPTNAEALNPPAGAPRFSRIDATPEFTKLTAGYSRMKALSADHSMMFRFAGQYTRDRLTSLEQFSIGGANQLRAVQPSTFLTDRGAFGSVEWIVRAPGFGDDAETPGGRLWKDVMSMSLFVDHTRGWVVDPMPNVEQPSHSLTGYGMSMNVIIPGSWAFKLQYSWLSGGARPGTSPTDPNRIDDARQLWLELNYSFW